MVHLETGQSPFQRVGRLDATHQGSCRGSDSLPVFLVERDWGSNGDGLTVTSRGLASSSDEDVLCSTDFFFLVT